MDLSHERAEDSDPLVCLNNFNKYSIGHNWRHSLQVLGATVSSPGVSWSDFSQVSECDSDLS